MHSPVQREQRAPGGAAGPSGAGSGEADLGEADPLASVQFAGRPSAGAVAAAVSHWAEDGPPLQMKRDGAPAAQNPLLDATQNPDPTNEYAPQATYGEVKGTVAVKGEGDEHEFADNDVQQGALGDCYLVAQLAAQARANPERIKKLIKDNGDGTFTVTLYLRKGGRRVATPVVVDSQFPQKDGSVAYAKPGDKGEAGPELWPMLIEKAFAKVSGSFEKIRGSKTSDGDVFAMVTGVTSTSFVPAARTKEQLLDALGKAVAAGQGVTFGAKNKTAGDDVVAAMKTDGVVANHAYSLTSVDAKAGTVSLRNPWGVKHLENLAVDKVQKYFSNCKIGAK